MLIRSKPLVVVAGTYQRGKSTLINGLIGHLVAEVGEGIATTSGWTRYRTRALGGIEAVAPSGEIQQHWPGVFSLILQQVDLADTPGFDADGVQGEADALASDEALAQADIILYVTNQTGLIGATERAVLGRACVRQPVVIALQNVFVSCSKAKRAQWLALLDKQLSDLGVIAWQLQPDARALSVNVLQLAMSVGVATDEAGYLAPAVSRGHAAQLGMESGLQPLITFLTSQDPSGFCAAELSQLRRATLAWVGQRAELVKSQLQTLIKPCQ